MKKCLQIVFFFLFFLTLQAQKSVQWISKKDKIKIPFELTHNLIIVDVVFNEIPLKMIADTGAEQSLLFSFPENDSLTLNHTDKIEIKGVGSGESLIAYLSKKNLLNIKGYTDTNFEMLLIPNQDISIVNKLGVPVNGVLGSSFFKSYLIEINYDKKQLILYKKKQEILNSYSNKSGKIEVQFDENKPYVNININNNNLKLLFDTGLSDGLWLFEDEKIKCNSNFFNDILGRGLAGDILGKRSRVESVNIANFRLNNALVAYPDSSSFNQIEILKDRNGSLGGEVIKRFNWVLDYENKNFYYKKNSLFNEPFEYNMSGIEVQHSGSQWIKEEIRVNSSNNKIDATEYVFDDSNLRNKYHYELKPIFEIYAVRENSPAAKAGLQVGDKIIKINNKTSSQLSIQDITNLFQSDEGKWINITVERGLEKITFKFQLEKIL